MSVTQFQCVCLVLWHQCISHLHRNPHFSIYLVLIWIEPLAICGIFQPDQNKTPQVVLLPFPMPRWALWVMPKDSALLLRTFLWHCHPCAGIHHLEHFHLHPLNTHMYIYLSMYLWRCFSCLFLLPSHLELFSPAFCKVESLCASPLGLSNIIIEIDST